VLLPYYIPHALLERIYLKGFFKRLYKSYKKKIKENELKYVTSEI